MHSWKFTDEEGFLCVAKYQQEIDKFIVCRSGKESSLFTYDPEEVESLLDRGIWKRLS